MFEVSTKREEKAYRLGQAESWIYALRVVSILMSPMPAEVYSSLREYEVSVLRPWAQESTPEIGKLPPGFTLSWKSSTNSHPTEVTDERKGLAYRLGYVEGWTYAVTVISKLNLPPQEICDSMRAFARFVLWRLVREETPDDKHQGE